MFYNKKNSFFTFLIFVAVFYCVILLIFGDKNLSKTFSTTYFVEAVNLTSLYRIPYNQSKDFVPWESQAAKKLPKKGSIFCMVLTTPTNYPQKVVPINETWLGDCDRGEFFTSEEFDDETIPATNIFHGFSEKRTDLFWKVIHAFYTAYEKISNQFDWYIKVDDDSYIFAKNLKEYLSNYDPSKPYYMGFRWKYPRMKNGYNSGGAYLLSKAAVAQLLSSVYQKSCKFDEIEDVGIGKCLASLGIIPLDTKDKNGGQRFIPHDFGNIFDGFLFEQREKMFDEPKKAFEAFSPELILLHHIDPSTMRLVHFIRKFLKNK
uniref:N-acetylgalactosaminide beta-1,3-galactosyltransferase n=1 Tax=Panagrolaimus sp. JU765 TaxID=591449 RepID=A0AC34QRZ9_9BILA